jgi:hypothetical protein
MYFFNINILKMLLLLSSLSLYSAQFNTTANVLVYNIEYNDKVIGYLKTSRFLQASEQRFSIESDATIKIITSINVHYHLDSKYKDNVLHYSKLINIVNGDTQKVNIIHWDGLQYLVTSKDKQIKSALYKINLSIGNFYFKEPVNIPYLYSDNFQRMCPITKKGEYYHITFPDGNTNQYKFVNGYCTYAIIQQPLAKLIFRLKSYQ